MNQLLIYTCGFPFSGKSTLARAISAETGFDLIEVDAHMTSTENWRDAYVAACREMRMHLTAGRSVVLDSVAHTRKNRYRLHRIAAEHRAEPICVWLDVSEAEADRRRRENELNPIRAHVHAEGFQKIVSEFELPDETEGRLIFRQNNKIDPWIESQLLPLLAREAIAS